MDPWVEEKKGFKESLLGVLLSISNTPATPSARLEVLANIFPWLSIQEHQDNYTITLRRLGVQVTAKWLVPASSLQPADQPEQESEPAENHPRERGKTTRG